LLHKDAVESTAYHHKKAVSTILMIPSKGHYLVDPVDDINLTAVPLLVRVGFTPLESLRLETERGIISNGVNPSAEFNATTGLTLLYTGIIEKVRRSLKQPS